MMDAHACVRMQNTKWIKATPEALYRAFTDPAALAVWFALGDMIGEVHRFDGRVGYFLAPLVLVPFLYIFAFSTHFERSSKCVEKAKI